MEKVEKILQDLGLSENETNLYLLALQSGQTNATILAKKSGLPRSTSQYTCQSLVKKGIFSMYPKWNTFIFSAEDPEKLKYLIEKEHLKLERKSNSLDQILWDLKNMINPYASLPKVKYYQWVDGIIEMFEDALKENKTIYWALDLINTKNDELKNYITKNYKPRRIKKGIKTRRLVSNKNAEINQENDTQENSQTIWVPHDKYPFSSDLTIYGNKVSFFSYATLSGVIIENEYIKNTIFSLYKSTWDHFKMMPENKVYAESEIKL